MRIIVLNEAMEPIGVIGIVNTLIWVRRYYKCGSFELYFPAQYYDLVRKGSGAYIYRTDHNELGVIRERNFTESDTGKKTAYAKGYFSETLLENRVINSTYNKSGLLEDISRDIVDQYCINSGADRRIPNLSLGARHGIGTNIRLQATGANVREQLYTTEQAQGMSHRLVYSYEDNTLEFEVWQGLDRTDTQDVNSWATFSDSFRNIRDAVYNQDETAYKNVAYVAGAGEGSDREIVEVDIRTDPDEERREVWVDARDLQKTYVIGTTTHTYSDAEYREMLTQRGLDKLAQFSMVETVNSNVDPSANLVYGVDYDLGDLCTYRYTDVNIEMSKRITEVTETIEGSRRTLALTFGIDKASDIRQVIKRET